MSEFDKTMSDMKLHGTGFMLDGKHVPRENVYKPVCQGVDGPCDGEATRRRQNTRYVEDERNYVVMCDKCFEYTQLQWAEQWREYHSEVLEP